MKVKIEHDPSIAGTRVWFYEECADGSIDVVGPLEFTIRKYEPAEAILEPSLIIPRHKCNEFMSSLATALVEAGYKPDELKAHDRQVEAIKYHLEDLRKLIFKGK